MPAIEFIHHPVSLNEDLIDYVEQNWVENATSGVGEQPNEWIDELNLINQMLTGQSLVGATGLSQPPLDHPNFTRLGEGVYRLKGVPRSDGLWVERPDIAYNFATQTQTPATRWTHYRIGGTGTLALALPYQSIPVESLLPQNFQPGAEVVRDNGNPVYRFDLTPGNNTLTVFGKRSRINSSGLYHPPSYRKTPILALHKISAKEQVERFAKLQAEGVKVPEVVGYINTPVQDYLFTRKVEGYHPFKSEGPTKGRLIEQDAQILAALCLLGYHKQGFEAWDDKIFDDTDLYLIDADELVDLYGGLEVNFRAILVNPSDKQSVDDFREYQRKIFTQRLRDTIYNYQEDFLVTPEERHQYVRAFFRRVNWSMPSIETLAEFCKFPANYVTFDTHMAMMFEA